MLRILSDLHFRDAATRLRRLEELDPLLDGVSELWLNGDSCDNQSGMPAALVQELIGHFTARVTRVRFITGNHDPDISPLHEISTADGRLWATHGDVFLDTIVPWSRSRDHLLGRLAAQRDRRPDLDFAALPDRLTLMRAACTGLQREVDPERADRLHLMRRLVMEFFPPRQPWNMVRTWWTFPDLVARWAPVWRPAAQIVVTGHIHFPRIWRRGALTIINTGAFSSPFGAQSVDLTDDVITVRRVVQQAGEWRAGAPVASIALATVAPVPVSNRP